MVMVSSTGKHQSQEEHSVHWSYPRKHPMNQSLMTVRVKLQWGVQKGKVNSKPSHLPREYHTSSVISQSCQ